jgi:F-type H+-transporting ATPase subunit b
MLIDWFTVGAQALNFIILVWLLRRFLYKPILNAVDAREKLIAGKLADAESKKAEAQRERDAYARKNEAFDHQRADLLSKATHEAKAERRRLLDDAGKAADALGAKRQQVLRDDAGNLNRALRLRTEQEVFAIARKALADLADASLEERVTAVFVDRLRALDTTARTGFAASLKAGSEPAVVRSAFGLPAAQRALLQKALNEVFSADIQLRFETAPDLVGGIELTANGQKLAWSIADYLSSLEKAVGELLKEKPKSEASIAPADGPPKARAENL